MTKSVFERILSLIDRKKILVDKLQARSFFFCKTIDGILFQFYPTSMTKDGHIDGFIKGKQLLKIKSRAIICLFHVGKDRYFLATKLFKVADGFRLLNSAHFYKLNRREHFRIPIPKKLNIHLQIKTINKHAVNEKIPLLDFSAAGARVDLSFIPGLVKDSLIDGQLLWFKEKNIPVVALVKHQTKKGICGIRFIFTDSIQQSRFKMMSIELQQYVHFT